VSHKWHHGGKKEEMVVGPELLLSVPVMSPTCGYNKRVPPAVVDNRPNLKLPGQLPHFHLGSKWFTELKFVMCVGMSILVHFPIMHTCLLVNLNLVHTCVGHGMRYIFLTFFSCLFAQ
jgi:hypothetical protein